MYDRAKEQQKEIATIKERTIHLNLSDADCKRISTYAAKANITVSQLLESFIGDLVNGTYTNGSDERDYAQEWFERCGYGMNSEKTFLRYILEEGADMEFLLNGLEGIKKSKELIQMLTEELQKEIDRQRENPEYQYEWAEEDSNGAGRVGCSDSVCERVVGRVSGMEKAKKLVGCWRRYCGTNI